MLSHGGTWEDENKSEDEILAKRGAGYRLDHQRTYALRAEREQFSMGTHISYPAANTEEIWDHFP